MQVEESENNAALWATHTDAELMALHGRLLASIPPAETAGRALAGGGAEHRRTGADVRGMRDQAPAAVFDAFLDVARQHMDGARWAKLARSLGLGAGAGSDDG